VHSDGRGRGAARARSTQERAEWRKLEQLERAERDVAELEQRMQSRSETLSRRFDDVLAVLEHWGYVRKWSLTERGERLVRIYHECDLVIAESLALGLFDGLAPASLAALASCFTYEHRSPEPPAPPWFPTRELSTRVERVRALGNELNTLEAARRLPITRPIDTGFVPLAYAWAAGETLESVLEGEEVSGGDFVRNVKQLVDLLRQIGDAATNADTSHAARAAADALQRGVVAASTQLDTDDLDDEAADVRDSLDRLDALDDEDRDDGDRDDGDGDGER
jgi:ATP-dependent RNA helicase HelY